LLGTRPRAGRCSSSAEAPESCRCGRFFARDRLPFQLASSTRRELEALGDDVVLTLTREQRDGFRAGRVDAGLLREAGFPPEQEPRIFVCGPTPFVEAVASELVELGHPPERVKTERFGPTGR
jgi:ferredoxin-NADP reductase